MMSLLKLNLSFERFCIKRLIKVKLVINMQVNLLFSEKCNNNCYNVYRMGTLRI